MVTGAFRSHQIAGTPAKPWEACPRIEKTIGSKLPRWHIRRMARSSSATHPSSVTIARSRCAREPGIRRESGPWWQENAPQTERETSLPCGQVLPRSRDAPAAHASRQALWQDVYPQAPSVCRWWSGLNSLRTAARELKSTLPADLQPPASHLCQQTPRQTISLRQGRAPGLKPTGRPPSSEELSQEG